MTDRDELAREKCRHCDGAGYFVTDRGDHGFVQDICADCNGTGWTAREAREKCDG